MRALASATLCAALAACGGAPDAPAAPPPPPFELRPVVAAAIAALEAELGLEHRPAAELAAAITAAAMPAATPPDPAEGAADVPADVAEETEGLVTFLRGAAGDLREAALEDARSLGDGALPVLAAIAQDAERDGAERVAAIELVAAVASPRAAEVLMTWVEHAPEPWMRSHGAWRLGELDHDHVVPRLVLRLKYEKDYETAAWIAGTLARFDNYSGVPALQVIWSGARSDAERAAAERRLVEIAQRAGMQDAGAVRAAWERGELPPPARSPRFELEVWRRIAVFGEFQLRGVDDSRFMLSQLASPVAELLSDALHDEDRHVRVHVAQSLQRMGPRAAPAASELVLALGRRDLAPHAADALGAIGVGTAEPALGACLDASRALEVRVAAARALGELGLPSSAGRLRPLVAPEQPRELRQAAAEALVRTGAGDEVVDLLVELGGDPLLERRSTLAALRRWIVAQGEADAETLAAWDALEPADDSFPTIEERDAIARARLELVRALRGR